MIRFVNALRSLNRGRIDFWLSGQFAGAWVRGLDGCSWP